MKRYRKRKYEPQEFLLKDVCRNKWWYWQVRSFVTTASSVKQSSEEYVFMVSTTILMQYPLAEWEIPIKKEALLKLMIPM